MSMRKAMFLPGWERLVPTVQMVTEILWIPPARRGEWSQNILEPDACWLDYVTDVQSPPASLVVWAIAGEWLAPFLAYVDAQKKKKKKSEFFLFSL
jgi:hypothetical protein